MIHILNITKIRLMRRRRRCLSQLPINTVSRRRRRRITRSIRVCATITRRRIPRYTNRRLLLLLTSRNLLKHTCFELLEDFVVGAFLARVGLEPIVLQNFLGGEARVGVHVDYAFEEVETLVGEVVTDHFVVASLDSARA